MRFNLLFLAIWSMLVSGDARGSKISGKCTPAYAELEGGPLKVSVGVWEISFNLLVVGCRENLLRVWPPDRRVLESELALEMQEPHPVQTLFLIRERSPELRKRLTKRLNKIFQEPVVSDVFLFDAKAAE